MKTGQADSRLIACHWSFHTLSRSEVKGQRSEIRGGTVNRPIGGSRTWRTIKLEVVLFQFEIFLSSATPLEPDFDGSGGVPAEQSAESISGNRMECAVTVKGWISGVAVFATGSSSHPDFTLSRPRAPIRPASSNAVARAVSISSPAMRNIAKSAATAHVSGVPIIPATGSGIAPPNPRPPSRTGPSSAGATCGSVSPVLQTTTRLWI
jgi:hypothetical protein